MRLTYAPLRALMAERGVSFYRLRLIGVVTPRAAKNLLNDSGYVSLQTIDLLCEYFDVEPAQILKRRLTED